MAVPFSCCIAAAIVGLGRARHALAAYLLRGAGQKPTRGLGWSRSPLTGTACIAGLHLRDPGSALSEAIARLRHADMAQAMAWCRLPRD